MCRRPVDLSSMHVDHIIPEELEAKPSELAQVLIKLGRPPTFAVNGPANWMPSCGPCNLRKGSMAFDTSLEVQVLLQLAQERSPKVQEAIDETVSDRRLTIAMNTLERSFVDGSLEKLAARRADPPGWMDVLAKFFASHRVSELQGRPVWLAPMLEVISDLHGVLTVRGPYGVGSLPSTQHRDASWHCSNCGTVSGWNGARCVRCGQMDED